MLNSRAAGSQYAYENAARIVREDADNGGVMQQFLIAVISRDHDAPKAAKLSDAQRERFFAASREQIRDQAEIYGNPLALYVMSMEKNDIRMLAQAASSGNVQALNAYGIHLLTNAAKDVGDDANAYSNVQKKAYSCFKWASDQGDMNGMYNVGMCHMSGYGCKKDAKYAFNCFRAAADAGHPEAINNLGGFFRDGIVVRRNLPLSVVWFKKSSDLGNEFGMLNYAMALLSGDGVEKNQTEAIAKIKLLAEERGNAEGMNVYGMCLMHGTGVEKNETAAIGWLEKSAAADFPMAMANLASCYENGVGVKPDVRKALYWKMRGRAAGGDVKAMEWLKANEK